MKDGLSALVAIFSGLSVDSALTQHPKMAAIQVIVAAFAFCLYLDAVMHR